MEYKTITKITEVRVIAGILREALLSGREILISDNEHRYWTKVKDIKEESIRDRTASRYFTLAENPIACTDRLIEFAIPFGRFLYRGITKLVTSGSSKVFDFPGELSKETQREFERFKIGNDSRWSKIALINQNSTIAAEFAPEDINQSSIGGLLTISAGIALTTNTFAIGKLRTKNGDISFSGVVNRISEIVSGEDQVYRIVIERKKRENSESRGGSDSERRSDRRFQTMLPTTIVSPVLNKSANIVIKDLNSSSFRAEPAENENISFFVFGLEYRLEDQNISFHIISRRYNEYVFEVISGDEKSYNWWFKKYSKIIHPSITFQNFSGEEILRLFCEAGAFSTNFIKGSQKEVEQTRLQLETGENSVNIHRWIEVNQSTPVAYASALRLNPNLWCVGDIVASQDPENRASKTFFPAFLYAFSKYLSLTTPTANIVMLWTAGHPFWTLLEESLSKNIDRVSVNLFLAYTRITGERNFLAVGELSGATSEISPKDFSKISRKYQKHTRDLIDHFLAHPGTGPTSYPVRAFFTQIGKIDALGITFAIPDGASINKLPESLFILTTEDPTEAEWEHISQQLVAVAYRNGLFPASLRRIKNSNPLERFASEQASMRLLVFQPEVMGVYR